MILRDFGSVIFPAIHVDLKGGAAPVKEYIRTLVINTVRSYNARFRSDYGELIICFDSRSWRQDLFPLYKWVRKQGRDNDDNDWDNIFEYITEIQDDLREHFPFRCVSAYGAEADDSIAYLASVSKEPTLIISNDKDLVTLTRFGNVEQFRPFMKSKAMFTVPDPIRFEFDLICGGDEADGIPSIRCPESWFKTKFIANRDDEKIKRAPPVTVKLKNEWYEAYQQGGDDELRKLIGEEMFMRFMMNRQLIQFDRTPSNVIDGIKKSLDAAEAAPVMKTLAFLGRNKMNLLAKEISTFKVNKTPNKTRQLF